MQISFRYVTGLLLFSLLMQEAHELSHLLANRLVKVYAGNRNFLYWEMCTAGNKYKLAFLALAGPFINFFFMWMGYSLLTIKATPRQRSYGFSFIMAALPLQRLQAIVFRGSDEIFAFRKLLGHAEPFKGAAVIAGVLLILLLALPPVYGAYIRVKDKKNGLLILALCLLVPFIFITLLQQLVFNTAWQKMLLTQPVFLHLPSWLMLIDLLLLLLFIPFAKSMGSLFSS